MKIEKEQLVELVSAVQKGEETAMTEMYDSFYDDIYYYIMKTVNDADLAADLTQDAFMEIFRTIDALRDPAAFVTWSKKVAYHKCTAHFRKKKDILLDETEDGYSVFDMVEEEREEFIPDEALDQDEFKKTIKEMIDSLPEEQRSAIMMRYFDELSVREIAEIQDVTEGTVKSRLNYGRKAIKQSVEDYEKANGIKIHCKGIVPILLWIFKDYQATTEVAASATTASVVATAGKSALSGVKVLIAKIVACISIVFFILNSLEMEKSLESFDKWEGYEGDEFEIQAMYVIQNFQSSGANWCYEITPELDPADPLWNYTGLGDASKITGGAFWHDAKGGPCYVLFVQAIDEKAAQEVAEEIRINTLSEDWGWYEGTNYFKGFPADEFVYHINEDLVLVSYVDPAHIENGTQKSSEEMNEIIDMIVYRREKSLNKNQEK